MNRLSSHRKGIAVLISLGLIWGYSVFRTQIGEDVEWAGLLIALGVLSVFSFFFHAGGFTTPPPQWSFAGLAVLFALYVAFQLIPLPIGLLLWLSPARVEVHDGLGALAAAHSSFVSLSALPSATMDHLVRIFAYALVFFLVTDIAVSIRKRMWLLATPIIAIALPASYCWPAAGGYGRTWHSGARGLHQSKSLRRASRNEFSVCSHGSGGCS